MGFEEKSDRILRMRELILLCYRISFLKEYKVLVRIGLVAEKVVKADEK